MSDRVVEPISTSPESAQNTPSEDIPFASAASIATPSDTPRTIDRLTRIEIENYRAFRGHFELYLPDGCNLIVYGENGAGKSSLYHAITDFLESPHRKYYDELAKKYRSLKHDDYRHHFNDDSALVRLSFGSKSYEWSASAKDPSMREMRDVDKGKGCLDYRSLLKVHLLPSGSQQINLFDIFIRTLLSHHKNPISSLSRTFLEEWKIIESKFEPRIWKPAKLHDWIAEFNTGFEQVVRETAACASKLLAEFDGELAVDIHYVPANYTWNPKKLYPPIIIAKPSLRSLHRPDYHAFLNEARLSALALAIYFAGLKQSPATGYRLLALDDVLIGLDMANRMAVLRMIEKHFKEWQVFIFTYSKAWFEILKSRTSDGRWITPWKSVVLRMGRSMGREQPILLTDSKTMILQARHYFDQGDVRAAAVYARSAWEALMSWYCCKWRLPVPYVESRRALDTNAFLSSIEQHLETLRDPIDREYAVGILREIMHARRFVLNPYSHHGGEVEDEICAEVGCGIQAVEEFNCLLNSIMKKDFAGQGIKSKIRVEEMIIMAVDHHEARRFAAATDALKRAFEKHLDEWMRHAKIRVPYGTNSDVDVLFQISGELCVFGKIIWRKLRHYKKYLLGNISMNDFVSRDFMYAVRLLQFIRMSYLLRKL